jgi:hypothetical protein
MENLSSWSRDCWWKTFTAPKGLFPMNQACKEKRIFSKVNYVSKKNSKISTTDFSFSPLC